VHWHSVELYSYEDVNTVHNVLSHVRSIQTRSLMLGN